MNIMSLDAAYGTGTIDDMQTAPDASDFNSMNGKDADPSPPKKRIQPMQLLNDADLNLQPRYSKTPQQPPVINSPPSGFSKLPPLPGQSDARHTPPQRPPFSKIDASIEPPPPGRHHGGGLGLGPPGNRPSMQSELRQGPMAPPFQRLDQPFADSNERPPNQNQIVTQNQQFEPVRAGFGAHPDDMQGPSRSLAHPQNQMRTPQSPVYGNPEHLNYKPPNYPQDSHLRSSNVAGGANPRFNTRPGPVLANDNTGAQGYTRMEPRRTQSERFSRVDPTVDQTEIAVLPVNEKPVSFFKTNRKVIMLVTVVIIALIIGGLIALVVHKMKHKGGTQPAGSMVLKPEENFSNLEMNPSVGDNTANMRGGGGGAQQTGKRGSSRLVPQYVGEYLGDKKWDPSCAWYDSASAIVNQKKGY